MRIGSTASRGQHRGRVTALLIMALQVTSALMLLQSCATQKQSEMLIDTRHVAGVDYLPDEMTDILVDLGYRRIPETLPERLAQNFEEYHVQFKARDVPGIRVDVHMRLLDQVTRIHLYNINEKTPGAATLERYETLRRRMESEFGPANVK